MEQTIGNSLKITFKSDDYELNKAMNLLIERGFIVPFNYIRTTPTLENFEYNRSILKNLSQYIECSVGTGSKKHVMMLGVNMMDGEFKVSGL